jgi:hypothetical protein
MSEGDRGRTQGPGPCWLSAPRRPSCGLRDPQNFKSGSAGPSTPPVEFVRELNVADSSVHAGATEVDHAGGLAGRVRSLRFIEYYVCCVCSSGHVKLLRRPLLASGI